MGSPLRLTSVLGVWCRSFFFFLLVEARVGLRFLDLWCLEELEEDALVGGFLEGALELGAVVSWLEQD